MVRDGYGEGESAMTLVFAGVVWVIVIVSYSDKSFDASTVNHAQACFLFLERYLVVGEIRRQYKTLKDSITRKDKDIDD